MAVETYTALQYDSHAHGWQVTVRTWVRSKILIEGDAARGISEVLFGLVADGIVSQAATPTGRPQRGEVGRAATECLLPCQRARTERRTLGSWFERRAAYHSNRSVELPLRNSARAANPLGPRLLQLRLRAEYEQRSVAGGEEGQ